MTPMPPRPPAPQKKGGCLKWVLLALGGSFLCCCCMSLAAFENPEDPLEWKGLKLPDVPVAGETELGTALIPADLPAAAARHYRWRENLGRWALGYGLSEEEHDSIYRHHEVLATRFHYRSGEGTNFTWRPPAECLDKEWKCVFDTMARDNVDDITPLTELFRRVQREKGLNALQTTELVVSFVQNITYRLPTEETAAFGMLPPAIVVGDGSGDCDSKALLSVMVLRQLGVDAVILLGSSLGHAALGVALPVSGKKFSYRGVKYAYVEVTAPGWVVGKLPPEYDVPLAWKVIPVNVP